MKKFYPLTKLLLLLLCIIFINSAYTQPLINNNINPSEFININAAFSVNAESECLQGNNFSFVNNSTTGSSVSYSWDFGDGTTSTEANPTHTYSTAGNFKIHLDVRSGNDYAFAEKFINVMPTPHVDFNILSGTLNGKSFTFISSSTIQSGSMNYFWNLGNGNTSTLINPTETYQTSGNYEVKLIVTSDFGCKDSISKIVNYATDCNLPTAAFTVNTTNQCKNNNRFIFTNQSSVIGGQLAYSWDFGDGTTSSELNPTKTYNNLGNYQVTLTVKNKAGDCAATANQTINVVGVNAAFVADPVSLQCFSNNKFEMTNESSASTSGLQYEWNFGDGTTSTASNPTKSYSSVGTYSITLIASTANSVCTDTIKHPVTIYPSATANFSINTSAQCKTSGNFILTNNSTPANAVTTNYTWDFGDGTFSSETNPTKVYANGGKYNITLTATTEGNGNCTTTAVKTVTVGSFKADFVADPVSLQCFKGNHFNFTNESTASQGNTVTYQWSLGEGTISSEVYPSKSYSTTGDFAVKLVAFENPSGCIDSITKNISVYASPLAGFYTELAHSTANTTDIKFTGTSSIKEGTIHYEWIFGDGTYGGGDNTTHTYLNSTATNTVQLIATSWEHACSDTATRFLSVATGISSGNSFIASTSINSTSDNNGGTSNITINTFPNPVQSNLQLNFATPNTTKLQIRIVDIYGRIVLLQPENVIANCANYGTSVNVKNLTKGTYSIQILNENGGVIGRNTIMKIN